MKVTLLSVGKKHADYAAAGIELFSGRLQRYCTLAWQLIPPVPIQGPSAVQEESRGILRALHDEDFVILLDETGSELSSPDFARVIERQQVQGGKRIVIIIGGAYGVTGDVKYRADLTMSLGPMVMPHQLVRLVLAEQLYRAFTIIKGEPYHHM